MRLVCISPGHAVSLARKVGPAARADGLEVDFGDLEAEQVEAWAQWAVVQRLAVSDAVEHLRLSLAA